MKKHSLTFGLVFLLIVLFLLIDFFFPIYTGMDFHQWLRPDLYELNFVESEFPCKAVQQKKYDKLITRGYGRMKNSRVVICGLARDLADVLPKTIYKVEKTAQLFADHKVLIFENDSADNTRQMLKDWQKQNNNVHLVECGVDECLFKHKKMYDYGATSVSRISKMAKFRNYYLDLVKQKYADYDYMLVVDMDLDGPWSLDGLANSVGHDDWDMISSYGLHTMVGTLGFVYTLYDGLAYLGLNDTEQVHCDTYCTAKHYLKYNFKDLRGIGRGDDMVQVKSGFAGMAIYRVPAILDSSYHSGKCEHVEFHKEMAQKGYDKLYMNPSQILLSGHQGPNNYLKFIFNNGNA